MTTALTGAECRQRLADLLTNFDTAMMVSECGKTHQLHARPMVVGRIDDSLNLWFFTEMAAPKIEEMKTNDKLCVTFQDNNRWISLAGNGRVENDRTLKMELWNASGDKLRKWFPEDKKIEDLTLLELETQWAEYWDSTGMMKPLQYSLEAIKSVVTGTRMDPAKASSHAKLSLSSPTSVSSQ